MYTREGYERVALDGVVLPLILDDLEDVGAVDVVRVCEQAVLHLSTRHEQILAEQRSGVVGAWGWLSAGACQAYVRSREEDSRKK